VVNSPCRVRVFAPARPFFCLYDFEIIQPIRRDVLASDFHTKQKSSLPPVRQTAFDDSAPQLLVVLTN